MKRIESLTKEQEGQMAAYCDKWIAQGLKTGETDWETFDKYMPVCYAKAGIKYPKNIVRVSSPLVGGLASSVAEAIWKKYRSGAVDGAVGGAVDDAVGGAVDGAVRGAVDDAVRGAVDDAVRGAVGDAVRGAVGGAVCDAVRGAVDDAVGDAVGGAVRGAVGGAVGDAVRGAVGDAVRGAVGGAVRGAVDDAVGGAVDGAVRGAVDDAVRGAVRTAISIAKKAGVAMSWHYWLGGQFWVGGWYWGVAFVNFFFDVCKLKLSKDIMERAEAYRKVCESVNYIWPNRDFVMVCARPKRIARNALGQLHSDEFKAIEYPDGWGLYLLNGVRFSEELWTKVVGRQMSLKEVMAIEDIDQRTQAMKYVDVEELIKEFNGKVLSSYQKFTLDGTEVNYRLVMIPKNDKLFDIDSYHAVYNCPSTQKIYMSGIDPELGKKGDIKESMAWKGKMSVEDWVSLIPLVSES
jgi:hypothetical protein